MKIYKFYKPECDPCKTLVKMMDKMEIPPEYEIIEIDVNVEINKQFAYSNGINKTPSLMYEDGSKKMIGLKRREEIMAFFGI
jgi:hypothetical protein